jgi:hypothetical protein
MFRSAKWSIVIGNVCWTSRHYTFRNLENVYSSDFFGPRNYDRDLHPILSKSDRCGPTCEGFIFLRISVQTQNMPYPLITVPFIDVQKCSLQSRWIHADPGRNHVERTYLLNILLVICCGFRTWSGTWENCSCNAAYVVVVMTYSTETARWTSLVVTSSNLVRRLIYRALQSTTGRSSRPLCSASATWCIANKPWLRGGFFRCERSKSLGIATVFRMMIKISVFVTGIIDMKSSNILVMFY